MMTKRVVIRCRLPCTTHQTLWLSNAGVARNLEIIRDNATAVPPEKTGIQGAYIQRMSSNLDSGLFRAWSVMLRVRVIRREKTGMTACGRFMWFNFLLFMGLAS